MQKWAGCTQLQLRRLSCEKSTRRGLWAPRPCHRPCSELIPGEMQVKSCYLSWAHLEAGSHQGFRCRKFAEGAAPGNSGHEWGKWDRKAGGKGSVGRPANPHCGPQRLQPVGVENPPRSHPNKVRGRGIDPLAVSVAVRGLARAVRALELPAPSGRVGSASQVLHHGCRDGRQGVEGHWLDWEGFSCGGTTVPSTWSNQVLVCSCFSCDFSLQLLHASQSCLEVPAFLSTSHYTQPANCLNGSSCLSPNCFDPSPVSLHGSSSKTMTKVGDGKEYAFPDPPQVNK